MEPLKIENEHVKMIAHRGLSGLEKENTQAAFIAAGNRSYYGIECDIHKTKDDQFVVIHDENTKRIAPFDLTISKVTYDELKSLDLYDVEEKKTKSHLKIPRLTEVIDTCKKYDKVLLVEMKYAFSETDVQLLLDLIYSKRYPNKIIIISFDINNLILVRRKDKMIPMQWITTLYDHATVGICRQYQLDINVHHQELSKKIVEDLHKHNILVNVWTVDNPIVALMLVSWGVDYITTNILE